MPDIEMPQLGETVTEGTITKWFKQVGDEVAEDEVLFEVSTDKVDSEVPSPAGGYLAEILVPEGETVDVGTRLAVVSSDAPSGDGAAAEPPEAEVAADQPGAEVKEPERPRAEPEEQEGAAEAVAKAQAGDAEPPAESTSPDASGEEPTAAESSGQARAEASSGDGAGGSMLLSPVVRRLINEHGLDAGQIQGTGAGGRITRSDVQKVIEQGDGGARAPSREPAAAPAAPAAATPSPRPSKGDTVEPLNNIRRRTAEHMVRSKSVSPHVFSLVEVDLEGVEQVRRTHKERFRADEGVSLTYLPFIARALVDAIAEFPHMNATVGDGELIVHHEVNLGIAVDLNYEGLIVPVIHAASDMRLRALARQIADLASRARTKKLSADDITGGTITISNNGGAGTLATTAIINQPQVAVLSVEGVSRRPVVVTDAFGSEGVGVHSVGNLTLSWDHRAFDGAYAGAFIARVRDLLETRDWEAEL